MTPHKQVVEKVKELIAPLFDEQYLHLVDVEMRGSGAGQVLSIYADTEKGITLKEITRLTEEISDLLDMHPEVVPGPYRLEVSSPGLDRPLRYLWQYRKNIGRLLKVRFLEEQTVQELVGDLLRVTEEDIVLQVDKQEKRIPLQSIERAIVKVKW